MPCCAVLTPLQDELEQSARKDEEERKRPLVVQSVRCAPASSCLALHALTDGAFIRPAAALAPEPAARAAAGHATPAAPPPFKAPPPPSRPLELQSYIISPYKSGSDSENEEEHPRKPVPAWARSEALGPVLYAQAKHDPDAIFLNPARTCSLSEVFQCAGNKKRDFTRRGSSGDWAADELCAAEETAYRRRFFGAGAAQ